MAEWDKVEIVNEQGEKIVAQAPVIISASRSTDIPAFYADWFIERLHKGFVRWINPFNGVPLYVSFSKARLIVFWSKNPKPMLPYLDELDRLGINYYFQFSLNNYDEEGFEPGVPDVADRIETFIKLSKRLGKERVIWRFDPLLLTQELSVQKLLEKIEWVGSAISAYTSRLVFSFADIGVYTKVKRNLKSAGILAHEFSILETKEFSAGLSELNKQWGLSLGTCAEEIDLNEYGIEHNRCIDDRLIIKCFEHDHQLMKFLGHDSCEQMDLFSGDIKKTKRRPSLKDKGQRKACGCIMSKDIGAYNTCPHGCVYCYANASSKTAFCNFKRHQGNPHSASIKGEE